MKTIWIKCGVCDVMFDREEGRSARGTVCPQCKTRVQEEQMIKTACSFCGRLTLTRNGRCPWCDPEEEESEQLVSIEEQCLSEPEQACFEMTEPEKDSTREQEPEYSGSVDYIAGKRYNLELKTTNGGIMTMGYQYRLLKPELVFRGQLRLFLNEIRKSRAAGRIAIELAAASVEEDGCKIPVCCLNVRVFSDDSPQTVYRLCEIAKEDVCNAFEHCGIAWKKARFDDEGTVGVMPEEGYTYLTRPYRCRMEDNEMFFYTEEIESQCRISFEHLQSVLTASPDSGISFQFMPTVLNRQEMELIEQRKARFSPIYYSIDKERENLYMFTCSVWGKASEEITDLIAVTTRGYLTDTEVFPGRAVEYIDVTTDPWHLGVWLCNQLMDPGHPMHRLPCMITADEISELLGTGKEKDVCEPVEKEQKQASEESEFLIRQMTELSALVRKNSENIQSLLGKTPDVMQRKLLAAELQYLGIESADELAMTEPQLDTLQNTIFSIRPMGIFSKNIIEADNYLPFTFMIGYLYELLIKECYHHNIYEPYCIRKGKVYQSSKDTALVCYETGPDRFGVRWDWKNMAQDLSDTVSFEGKSWSSDEWYDFFKDMNHIRKLRNKVHVIDKNGDVSFVSSKAACDGIRLMLEGPQSLMRRILLCRKAVFGKKR